MSRGGHPVGGKVVLVTGAARGIGAETARRLARRGARVALLDIDAERLERTAAAIPGSFWLTVDVTDRAALQAAVDRTVETLGGIDVAIANAGIAAMSFTRSMDPAEFGRIVEVNLVGAFNTLHAALAHVAARRGYLLAVSSLTALAHVPGLGAYSASKAGLEAFCDALRSEVGPLGVGVGVAYLSWIDTELVRGGERTQVGPRLKSGFPPPFHRVDPVSDAGRAIVRAVEHRAAHVSHPRWLLALLPLRGILQPVIDREMRRRLSDLDALSQLAAARRGSAGSAPVEAGEEKDGPGRSSSAR